MSKAKLPPALEAEISALLVQGPDQIDTSDIRETPSDFWMNAKRPNFYKPTKQPVTLRLDSDIVAWFKEHTDEHGYQTEINRVLRRHVIEVQTKAG